MGPGRNDGAAVALPDFGELVRMAFGVLFDFHHRLERSRLGPDVRADDLNHATAVVHQLRARRLAVAPVDDRDGDDPAAGPWAARPRLAQVPTTSWNFLPAVAFTLKAATGDEVESNAVSTDPDSSRRFSSTSIEIRGRRGLILLLAAGRGMVHGWLSSGKRIVTPPGRPKPPATRSLVRCLAVRVRAKERRHRRTVIS